MAIEVKCARCNKNCYGDVVKVSGNYFHQNCFTCKVAECNSNLVEDGYFVIDGEFYCRHDYHHIKGTKCARCNFYVEGVAISAVDSIFHPTCFACFHCNNIFNPNIEVCYDGERIACESCTTECPEQTKDFKEIEPTKTFINQTDHLFNGDTDDLNVTDPEMVSINFSHSMKCASCGDYIGECKSLMALDKPWHLRCFTCHKCGKLLAEEYIGKDGIPYCEQDYQLEFGVLCSGCNDYITGKVLQAGGKHYHPSCSRCGKCNELFGEGEEMYLRGSEIWHPRCSEKDELIEVMSDTNISDADIMNTSINPPDNAPEILDENISVSAAKRFFERQSLTKEQSTPIKHTSTNGHSSKDTSAGHTVNVWRPPYQTSQSVSLSKPVGFQPVIPPRPSTVTASHSEDEDPPLIPRPPKRSSSSSWRLKYSASDVYTPVPFQTISAIKNDGPITDTGTYLNSASSESDKKDMEPIDMKNQVLLDTNEELDMNGASPSLIRKGLGYNKLQYRRSLRESQRRTGNK